jgi:non-specific serine/threonine protein kinase/serine/threonine-protein kinase
MNMTESPDPQYDRVKRLLLAVMELEPGARGAWLAALEQRDAADAARVRQLLDAADRAESFLDVPEEGWPAAGTTAEHPAVRPDDRIGPFVIAKELGTGGMGVVVLGHREHEGFTQSVAIKLLRLGSEDRYAAARLAQERSILASLSHPFIAHLVDGGTTEDGRPYIAMEYVDGVPIDRYCESHQLSVNARVRLFLKVCSAVHFAHHRLVIHRDIKPSNILVTSDGNPKLLDFGIAALTDVAGGVVPPTLRVLTPNYASPEQVGGGAVTTATDVYSMGVLLYELLAGSGPYSSVTRDSSPWAVINAIKNDEPDRPSVMAAANGRPPIDPDLDAVLLKTLRKDESERYASAEALAQDLAKVLDGQPVSARSASRAYVVRKFVARNRAGIVAATVAILSLVAATSLSLWQMSVARRERARADARFHDVRRLANAVIGPLYDSIAKVPGSTETQALLVKEALAYLDGLFAQAEGDLDLKNELAEAYRKLGDVQGNLFGNNLGNVGGARESYKKMLELQQAVSDGRPADGAAARRLAESLLRMGDLALGDNDPTATISYYERALRAFPSSTSSPEDTVVRSRAESRLGVALNWAGRSAEAVTHLQSAIALVEPLIDAPNEPTNARRTLLSLVGNLGDVFYYREQYEDALKNFQRGLALARAASLESTTASARRDVYLLAARASAALGELKRFDEAVVLGTEALTIVRGLAEGDSGNARLLFDMAATRDGLAKGYLGLGELQRSASESRAAVETMREGFAKSPDAEDQRFNYAVVLTLSGQIAIARRSWAEAQRDFRAALEQFDRPRVSERQPSARLEALEGLGDALAAFGRGSGSNTKQLSEARLAYQSARDGWAELERADAVPRASLGKSASVAAKLAALSQR